MDHAIELVNILLQYKANVNITNDEGWTPLHLAGILFINQNLNIYLRNLMLERKSAFNSK